MCNSNCLAQREKSGMNAENWNKNLQTFIEAIFSANTQKK